MPRFGDITPRSDATDGVPTIPLYKSVEYSSCGLSLAISLARPMSSPNLVVFYGSKVLLPDHDEPIEASIVVSADDGTILSVIEGPLSGIADDAEVIDAGDNIILPGLVE